MSKKTEYQNLLKNFSKGQYYLILFTIISVFVAEIYIIKNVRETRIRAEQSAVTAYGESVATGIKLSLEKSVVIAQVLEDLYHEYGNIFLDDFSKACKHFMEQNKTIGSCYYAPDGIIKYAYPDVVASSTIGFNMLEDPEQGESARLARDTGKITVAGPHALIEGGNGFIIRNPIIENGEFTGFMILVLDWDSFVDDVLNMIDNDKSGYNFAVWKEQNSHIVTDEYGFIINKSKKQISKNINIKIAIPNDYWILSVEPKNGWYDSNGINREILFIISMGLIIVFLVIFRQFESAKKLYTYEHDLLTGLLTRSAFYRRVRKLFNDNPLKHYDVILADIENFKLLNSIYGVKRCDELLQYVADSFLKIDRVIYMARYGGDKFIMISDSSHKTTAEQVQLFSDELIEKAPIKNLNIKYGYYSDVDKNLPVNLISDRALLAARSILHNYDIGVANYEGPVSKRLIHEQLLESSFEAALENKNFSVWYQPKFDAKTEKLVGAEALVRWIREDGTLISPGDFIPVFEDDGLIVRLDEYVFRTVCSDIQAWINEGQTVYPVSVNLSRKSISHYDVLKKYRTILDEYKIPLKYVSLEITESAASRSHDIDIFVNEIEKSGFCIDMDDFGTGSSSLACLNIMPFNVIKLDKSLIDFAGSDDGNELIKHTIQIAHFKKMNVVAEGVETKLQLDLLKEMNCDTIQGFYFSPPLSLEKYNDFLKSHN